MFSIQNNCYLDIKFAMPVIVATVNQNEDIPVPLPA